MTIDNKIRTEQLKGIPTTVTLTGSVTGSGTFDSNGAMSIATTVSNDPGLKYIDVQINVAQSSTQTVDCSSVFTSFLEIIGSISVWGTDGGGTSHPKLVMGFWDVETNGPEGVIMNYDRTTRNVSFLGNSSGTTRFKARIYGF